MLNSGIYLIKNLANEKVYVGQAVNIHKRWKSHQTMLKNNTHHAYKLQHDWNQYGEDNFVFMILELCAETLLNERERHYIDLLKAKQNGYNSNGTKEKLNLNLGKRNKKIDKIFDFAKTFVSENKIVLVTVDAICSKLNITEKELYKILIDVNKFHYEKFNIFIQLAAYYSDLVISFSQWNNDNFDNVEFYDITN